MPVGAFHGAARYYAAGRPPYAPGLRDALVAELGLDGRGRLVDVGCGPGTIALLVADLFAEVVGLDPEPEMLDEARLAAARAGWPDIRWIEGVAEDLAAPALGLRPSRVVTFGQSFHRTDRRRAAEAAYDLLEPGGAMVLISHAVDGRPVPLGPGWPAIPHDEVRALITDYLGDVVPPPGGGTAAVQRWEESVRATRFGAPRLRYVPGVPDYVRNEDSVVANYFSMSYAAPPRFGARRDAFETDLRALLRTRSPEGLFWDWPGDTEIVVAVRS